MIYILRSSGLLRRRWYRYRHSWRRGWHPNIVEGWTCWRPLIETGPMTIDWPLVWLPWRGLLLTWLSWPGWLFEIVNELQTFNLETVPRLLWNFLHMALQKTGKIMDDLFLTCQSSCLAQIIRSWKNLKGINNITKCNLVRQLKSGSDYCHLLPYTQQI